MTELVADCSRCEANSITFDLQGYIHTITLNRWRRYYEVFAICRNCSRSTVFVLRDKSSPDADYLRRNGIGLIEGTVNKFVEIKGTITLKDRADAKAPAHVPEVIDNVFCEGAMCLKVNCWNAAGTMFRLCIDLVTKDLIPKEPMGLNHRTRRSIGLLLPWLFDNDLLPESLRELSSCVREDGNDGAHKGTLSKEAAEDLMDFTRILLERTYTEPERIKLASQRRDQRREESA